MEKIVWQLRKKIIEKFLECETFFKIFFTLFFNCDTIWETIHKIGKYDFEKTQSKVTWSKNQFLVFNEIYREHC